MERGEPRFVKGMRIGVDLTDKEEQVALYVAFENNHRFIIDYYDTERDGIRALNHFAKCCETADNEGFSMSHGGDYFVHDSISNCSLTIAEALDIRVSTTDFRRTLHRIKTRAV